jgi:AcrR family transcriptional regulator
MKAARPYAMRARAEAAERTGERILDAAFAAFNQRLYDEVTLDDVAHRAGVSTQTVIRRFGSKEGLVAAVSARVREQVGAQRGEAPVGDVAGAVANLLDHYEEMGDSVLHLLAQEGRVAPFREAAERGRVLHREWVARTFAPWLEPLDGPERRRRHAQLVAVTDVYVWKLLRRDLRLGRAQTALALRELIEALTQGG